MTPKRPWLISTLPLAALLVATGFAAPAAAQGDTSCLTCHADADMVGEELAQIAENMQNDVHGGVGLSCHDCHGGNPDPGLADDMFAAMDESFAANPYVGAPERTAVPEFCGRCHSNPTYMKRFKPDARVDQEEEYWTSYHGQALKEGDTKVATCIDCHGVHGILGPEDTRSPVYATHVAETCGRCHSDPEHMAGYTLDDGTPLPVDQEARWQRSVHAHALLERQDLFAPTCNDCHGNHGATPPGLDAVSFVCGQCHGREASLFRRSKKQVGFIIHNQERLPMMGEAGCGECHEPLEPQSDLTTLNHFSECSTCHGNHAVVRPTVGLLAPLPETPCALCHEGPRALEEDQPEPAKAARHYAETRDGLLEQLRTEGLAGEDLFDRLVDEARRLPTHTVENALDDTGRPVLRPEFGRLFEKFRIGKTHFTYTNPLTGDEVKERVRRCTDCHGDELTFAGSPHALDTARTFLNKMQELTVMTARAERTTLAAKRGGMEMREALLDLDKAVDSQIELEVLIHTFSTDEGSAFVEKQAEGVEHATSALATARGALGELRDRHRGLAIWLVLIALVLVALGFKIRDLSIEGSKRRPTAPKG